MKRILLKLALLGLPFALYGGLVALADPLDYFPSRVLFTAEEKVKVASLLNRAVPTISAYRSGPGPRIIIGDSRARALLAEQVSAAAGERYQNLAFGGASLEEMIRTFWFCAERQRLEKVWLAVNFDRYNAASNRDLVGPAIAMQSNVLLYLYGADGWRGCGPLYASLAGVPLKDAGQPTTTKEEFWTYQVEDYTRTLFKGYRDPADYHTRLTEIAAHCRAHQIQLTFLCLPTHVDLQREADRAGLAAARERFLAELSALAPVINMDVENELTRDPLHFKDPYHFTNEVRDQIIRRVWGDRLRDSIPPKDGILELNPMAEAETVSR